MISLQHKEELQIQLATQTHANVERQKIAGGIREHNHSLWGKISLHQTMRHIGIPKVTSVSSSEDEDIQASPEGEKTKQKKTCLLMLTLENYSPQYVP